MRPSHLDVRLAYVPRTVVVDERKGTEAKLREKEERGPVFFEFLVVWFAKGKVGIALMPKA